MSGVVAEPLLVLTIGQAPRPDIAAELAEVLGEQPLEIRGALDGLSVEQIRQLAPIDDADHLHTRLQGAHDAVVSKVAVAERLNDLLDEAGPRPVVVACTGRFTDLPRRPNVLYPSEVLAHLVAAVLPPDSTVGVLVPLPEQVEPFERQWTTPQRRAIGTAVMPGGDVAAAAATFEAEGVDLVLLDCFGYDRSTLEQVRASCSAPVLSAVRCTGHLVRELLG